MSFEPNYNLDYDRRELRDKILRVTVKVLLWAIVLGGVIFGAWAITEYCIEKTNMTGNSMEPALSDGEKVLVNRLSYRSDDPDRFDVIVFNISGKEHDYYGIRRVIGLPGEKVQIIDGYVYINDEFLEEINDVEPMQVYGLAEYPIYLDDDEFFVLGDNRNDCIDSRYTGMGNVSRESIIGKAWIRLDGLAIISGLNKKD
ncbi:MAG: signal peptidase I [Lachnospiraceae bacterium]|nr:signal peptidase I [Lachnospiraceae bacterium]